MLPCKSSSLPPNDILVTPNFEFTFANGASECLPTTLESLALRRLSIIFKAKLAGVVATGQNLYMHSNKIRPQWGD